MATIDRNTGKKLSRRDFMTITGLAGIGSALACGPLTKALAPENSSSTNLSIKDSVKNASSEKEALNIFQELAWQAFSEKFGLTKEDKPEIIHFEKKDDFADSARNVLLEIGYPEEDLPPVNAYENALMFGGNGKVIVNWENLEKIFRANNVKGDEPSLKSDEMINLLAQNLFEVLFYSQARKLKTEPKKDEQGNEIGTYRLMGLTLIEGSGKDKIASLHFQSGAAKLYSMQLMNEQGLGPAYVPTTNKQLIDLGAVAMVHLPLQLLVPSEVLKLQKDSDPLSLIELIAKRNTVLPDNIEVAKDLFNLPDTYAYFAHNDPSQLPLEMALAFIRSKLVPKDPSQKVPEKTPTPIPQPGKPNMPPTALATNFVFA